MKSIKPGLLLLCLLSGPAVSVYAADNEIVQRLERIERLLQSQGLLDMLQQIESLQQEVSSLHGEIEFQNHTLEQLKKRQRDLYTDIDQRLQRIERAGTSAGDGSAETIVLENIDNESPPLETIEPVGQDIEVSAVSVQPDSALSVEVIDNASVESTPVEVTESGETEVSLNSVDEAQNNLPSAQEELDPVQIRAQYQQAFKLLKQSQYEQAIKAFREFLSINPQSEYSDNAQYWLGEAYYVTRQFEIALQEYNKLIQNYPASKKLTHSLLKIGFCYYETGELEEAKVRLENLRNEHPGTTAARLAEERLKKISQESQQQLSEAP